MSKWGYNPTSNYIKPALHNGQRWKLALLSACQGTMQQPWHTPDRELHGLASPPGNWRTR